jgi:hypothetical protein
MSSVLTRSLVSKPASALKNEAVPSVDLSPDNLSLIGRFTEE